MPSLIVSPSSRKTDTTTWPSMTTLSPTFRVRTSTGGSSGSGCDRQRVLRAVFGRVVRHNLLADARAGIDHDWPFEVDRGASIPAQGDDTKQQRLAGIFQI